MENKEEDEILTRWRAMEASSGHGFAISDEETVEPASKRRRIGAPQEQDTSIVISEKTQRWLVGTGRRRRAGQST